MLKKLIKSRRIGLTAILAALAVVAIIPAVASASITSSTFTFSGVFDTGVIPWTSSGGGVQCANYGVASKAPRLRGDFYLDTSTVGAGTTSGRYYLPADTNPSTYTLEQCGLVTGQKPIGLGTDAYYGLMVHVPSNFSIANHAFWGVSIHQFHFQGVWGSPIEFQLHNDHVTMALQTGACNNSTTSSPGCQYRSNADNTSCKSGLSYTCLPGHYVIPPGGLVAGAWNEMMMHVHWAADGTGQIQTWYRAKGASTWIQSSSVSGIPTVQWDVTKGCCYSSYIDQTEVYTTALTAPLTVWLDNDISASTLSTIKSSMP
ncbi:MAG: polysaccharide lyase [Actinobacteria bacterium]|nr:polysaccharide lyase [Actinomycetota bacterium]